MINRMMSNIKVCLLLLFCWKMCLTEADIECPFAETLEPAFCKCYPKTERLICEEKSQYFPEFIEAIKFKSIKIVNTNILKIEYFKNIKTDEIYIENNTQLIDIDPSIFSIEAHTVIINENKELNSENLLKGIPPVTTGNKLKKLRIRDSNLGKITPDAFEGLSNLEYILLEKNGLSEIDLNLFNNLPNLKEINLEHNNIKIIKGNFTLSRPINKTISINLNNNKITTEELKKFKVLSNDTKLTLFLNDNIITEFTSDPFKNLVVDKKYIIYLNGNKIICKWNEIEWIFPSENFSTNILNVYCANYNGIDIFKMTHDQFTDRTTILTSIGTTTEPSNPTIPTDRSEATIEPPTPTTPINREEPTTEPSAPTAPKERAEPAIKK